MIREYVEAGLKRARYDKLDDGTFVAEVPGLEGVLSAAPTLEACRDMLAEVTEEWVLVRVAKGLKVPALDGVEIAVTDER